MGIILLGRALTDVIGERFIVLSPQRVSSSMIISAGCIWVFTQAGIPLSITHVLICSIIGAALTKKIAIFNMQNLYKITSGAIGSPILSFSLAIVFIQILF
ncbi:MAG: inorganic phosphate transporter [Candidatus Hodarchaeota archaeon]